MTISSDRANRLQVLIELVANITIAVAVIVGISVWMYGLYASNHASNITGTNVASPTLHTKIVLPGVDWSTSKATLVIAMSSECRYCVDSASFYKDLTHRNHAAPIVIVMPQRKQAAQEFLRRYMVTPNNVISAELTSIQVSATPTVLLISSSGVVEKVWVGELTKTQQQEVFTSLDHI